MPTWLQNIPQATDKLSVSQGDLLGNFQSLNIWMDINHYLPTDIANQGKHKYVTMPVQGSDPVTGGSEIALYTKSSSGIPQIFWRQQNNGTVVNLTEGDTSTIGWSRLPSGVIVKWGTPTLSGNGGNFTYVQGPAFTTVLYIGVTTTNSSDASVSITSFTTTQANTDTRQRTTNTPINGITCKYLVMGI